VSEPSLVDSHCHVAEPAFDADRDAVLERAAGRGVTTLVCIGGDPSVSSARAVALAGRHGAMEIFASVGVHPHDARLADEAVFAGLEALVARPGVVAIGETGLDYYYEHSPRPVQREVFARSVALARSRGLPLVVHVRDAHGEAADLLRVEGAADVGGVIHCFTGNRAEAAPYLDLGFHVSVAGIVTFKNADALRDAVRSVPADRLLVETDAPFLAPVPYRGKRNEPAHVRVVAEAVAAVRGEPFPELAAATTANARRLFRLDG
jgi:TatD DNase family protein